jgi:hypothetical protein
VRIVFAALTCLFGIGLALRIEFIRGVANFICGIQIILGLLSAPATIAMALVMEPFGLPLILMRVLDIALAGFMIYLIGETDSL